MLKTFVWLGLTAFGGPAAHFAIFQQLLVGEGKWVSKTQYLRMLAAVNLIPGPNSTETAMLLGYARAGSWGLLLAGLGFIVPAAGVTLALVALYQEVASLPSVQGAFLGLKLAVVALIAQALWDLLPHPQKQPQTWVLALTGLTMAGLGMVEWAVVLLVGLLVMLGKSWRTLSVEPLSLFWFFFLVGSTLFGSGYVLIGLMQEMVSRGWLGSSDLLNALALGQITPGPLLTTATTAGYLAAGIPGAVLSTVGIFLPSFIFTFLVAGSCTAGRRIPSPKLFFREPLERPWDSLPGPCGYWDAKPCWAGRSYLQSCWRWASCCANFPLFLYWGFLG